MSTTNPWLSVPVELPKPVVAAPVVPAAWAAGTVTGVDQACGLDVVCVQAPGLYVMGAHGGAGTSTLACLLGAGDAGRAWPVSTSGGVRVLVAARTSAAGIRAAQDVAISWAGLPGAGSLAGVAWVADAPGRLPKELRGELALVSGAFPISVQVPWVGAWRVLSDPCECQAPSSLVKALSVLAR